MQHRKKFDTFSDEKGTNSLTPTEAEIEQAVEEELRQAKIKLDQAQAKAKEDKAQNELERAAAQVELDKELREARKQMEEEHANARHNLIVKEFLNRLDHSILGYGGIVQDGTSVAVMDAMEGYRRPGGARAVREEDLVKPEDIFTPTKALGSSL